MRERSANIAQRIRALREDTGISAKEMAGHIGLSESEYAEMENSHEDISASNLSKIASKLNVDLGLLLTGVTPKMKKYSVIRKDQGITVDQDRSYKYESFVGSFKDADFEPFVVAMPETAEQDKATIHTHPGQEFNYILEGGMKLIIEDAEIVLGEGDSVIFDSTVPHGLKALNGPVKFVAVISAR